MVNVKEVKKDEKKEILETLEGMEIKSITFEGVVLIENGQLWRDGKIIKKTISSKDAKILMNDAYENEFGNEKISKEMFIVR